MLGTIIIRYSESINIIVMLRRTILQNILRLMYGVDVDCSQRKRLSCVILFPLNNPSAPGDVDTLEPHTFRYPRDNISPEIHCFSGKNFVLANGSVYVYS